MAWELGGGGGRRQRDQFSASSTRTQRAGQSTKVFGAGGSSRRGAESCDGFRQKQPQTPDTSAAAVGGRRRPPHARLALGCALFSAFPQRDLRCERRSAAGSRQRATGRTTLPRPGQSWSRAAESHGPFGHGFPSAGAARSSAAQAWQAQAPLVILVRLVPAEEQLAGKCSAPAALAGSDRSPPLVFRAGERPG